MFKKIVTLVVSLILFVCALWGGGLFYFKSSILTEVEFIDRHTDAIVVLTGGSDRLEEGLMMLENNMAGRLFISGAGKGVTVDDVLRTTGYKNENAVEVDDLKRRIEIGYEAGDTIGNAQEVAAWVKEKGYRSFRLVTSNYHMIRSLLEMENLIEEEVLIVPHPVVPESVKIDEWLDYEGSRNLIVAEYNKLIMAWLNVEYKKVAGK